MGNSASYDSKYLMGNNKSKGPYVLKIDYDDDIPTHAFMSSTKNAALFPAGIW